MNENSFWQAGQVNVKIAIKTPLVQEMLTRETLIQSLSDFTLEFLGIARNNLTRIASYLRKVMTKLCIKILVKSDSVI